MYPVCTNEWFDETRKFQYRHRHVPTLISGYLATFN